MNKLHTTVPPVFLLRKLQRNKSLISCMEVSNYMSRADLLSCNVETREITEYEFKSTINGFRSDKLKVKFTSGHKIPNFFYYVLPISVYDENKHELMRSNAGIMHYLCRVADASYKRIKITTVKEAPKELLNVQDFDTARENIIATLNFRYYSMCEQSLVRDLPLSHRDAYNLAYESSNLKDILK